MYPGIGNRQQDTSPAFHLLMWTSAETRLRWLVSRSAQLAGGPWKAVEMGHRCPVAFHALTQEIPVLLLVGHSLPPSLLTSPALRTPGLPSAPTASLHCPLSHPPPFAANPLSTNQTNQPNPGRSRSFTIQTPAHSACVLLPPAACACLA